MFTITVAKSNLDNITWEFGDSATLVTVGESARRYTVQVTPVNMFNALRAMVYMLRDKSITVKNLKDFQNACADELAKH